MLRLPYGRWMDRRSRGFLMLPISFVDEHLPTLSDGEARLYLVVARQTIGWVTESGERKEWDWISHTELKRRMGRSGTSVSKAIEDLSARGLIRVGDEKGTPLTDATARRARFGKLYFALAEPIASPLPGLHNVETTIETYSKEKFKIRKLSLDPSVRIHRGWQRAVHPSELPNAPEGSKRQYPA